MDKDSKGMNLIQKLYRYRLKIDRKGTPIVNLSCLFCIPCLIFAPHMSIAGIIVSLILGYHIGLETEGDAGELEETLRNAAGKIRETVGTAAKTIREEIDKTRENNTAKDTKPAETVKEAPDVTEAKEDAGVKAITSGAASINQDIVQELEQETASVFRGSTAFTASSHSVPTLQVHEEPSAQEDASPKAGWHA